MPPVTKAVASTNGAAELRVDHVLRIGLPVGRRADQQQAGMRYAVHDAFDLCGLQIMFCTQCKRRVDTGMPVSAGGVGLDAGGHQLELAAEILHFARCGCGAGA